METSKNIDIVMKLYDTFAKQNIPAMLELISGDVEWGEPENPYNPAAGTRKGHNGFLEWAKIGRDAEDILVLQPKRFLTDEDSVAVIGYEKCRAKKTGIEYECDFVHFMVIRDGKIVKFQEFFDTYLAGEAFRQA